MTATTNSPPPVPSQPVLQPLPGLEIYEYTSHLPGYSDSTPVPPKSDLDRLHTELTLFSTKAEERAHELENEIAVLKGYIAHRIASSSAAAHVKVETVVKTEPLDDDTQPLGHGREFRESSIERKKDKKKRKWEGQDLSVGVTDTPINGSRQSTTLSSTAGEQRGPIKIKLKIQPVEPGISSQTPSATFQPQQNPPRIKIKAERQTPEPIPPAKVKSEKEKKNLLKKSKRSSTVNLALSSLGPNGMASSPYSRASTPPSSSASQANLPELADKNKTVVRHKEDRSFYYQNFDEESFQRGYDLLIGEDYSKVRAPQNQVAPPQFWSMIESYIRPLTIDDIRYLQIETDDPTHYIIPKLGPHYRPIWGKEERDILGPEVPSRLSKYPMTQSWPDDIVQISKEMCVKPLAERLISSLMNEGNKETSSEGNIPVGTESNDSALLMDENNGPFLMDLKVNREIEGLEERLKRELRNIGLLPESDTVLEDTQDDEICVTLRQLQSELREQHRLNQARKKRLLEVAEKRMAYQEYQALLVEAEKQIHDTFVKKFVNQKVAPKKPKKSKASNPSSGVGGSPSPTSNSPAQPLTSSHPTSSQNSQSSQPVPGSVDPSTSLPETVRKALERRKMLIELVEPNFTKCDKYEEFVTLPKKSIYVGLGGGLESVGKNHSVVEGENEEDGEESLVMKKEDDTESQVESVVSKVDDDNEKEGENADEDEKSEMSGTTVGTVLGIEEEADAAKDGSGDVVMG